MDDEDRTAGAVEVAMNAAAEAVALAFKVVHEPRSKKPVVWLRTYAGAIAPGDVLVNSRTGEQERPTRLVVLHGEESTEVSSALPGSICAAIGLRRTRTGDTLLRQPAVGYADARLPELFTPTPVFFTAVEVEKASQQAALDAALAAVCLEDPSVSVRADPVTGQQLVGGMGELHLQVIAERLRREHRLDLYTGAMQVAYREGVRERTKHESGHSVAPGGPEDIRIVLGIAPTRNAHWASEPPPTAASDAAATAGDGAGTVHVDALAGVRERLTRRELSAALEGLEGAAQYGHIRGYPVYGVRATLLSVSRPKGTSPEALRKASAEAIMGAIEAADPVLLEPLMRVELRTPERHVGAILKELTGKRRADVQQLGGPAHPETADSRHCIQAEVPLAALVGYANALRSLTQGEASLSMEFHKYRPISEHDFEEQQQQQWGNL